MVVSLGMRCPNEEKSMARSAQPTRFPSTGSVVALRRVLADLQAWHYAPRVIAIIALDSGALCFGWIAGGRSQLGRRVHLVGREIGEKYPTFALSGSQS